MLNVVFFYEFWTAGGEIFWEFWKLLRKFWKDFETNSGKS